MARLANLVHVRDEKGQSVWLGPDDEVPAWAESKITNPKAWAELPSVSALTEPTADPDSAPAKRPAPRRVARRKAASDAPVHDD